MTVPDREPANGATPEVGRCPCCGAPASSSHHREGRIGLTTWKYVPEAASAAAPRAPSPAAIEAARENEAVRDAFVDCYTLQSIVTEERGNVVDSEDLQRWDEVESTLIRAIVAAVDALRAGLPKEEK